MALARFWVLPLWVACSVAACSEPDSASSSSSAGAGGESPAAAGALSGGDSGVVDGAGEGPGGSAGAASTGGAEGLGGQLAAGGSPGAGGEPGGGGSVCVPPPAAPVSGSECPAACEGELIGYEDCDGDGLLQAACATDWFVIQQACGDHLCQDPAFQGQSCSPGQVCALLQGGAQLPECRPHDCETGPITCECLGEACPGCTQTGVLDFTCNTCPSGLCP